MTSFAVSTAVPFGNVCDVHLIEKPDILELRFSADPHGGLEALWFCFRMTQTSAPASNVTQVKLILQHIQNLLAYPPYEGMIPVCRPADEDWSRLSSPQQDYLPDGRLELSWTVSWKGPHLDIAFCYPYGLPDLTQRLKESRGYWINDTIGVSQQARPMHRLSNHYGDQESSLPGIYLIARQHAAETPSSWVLDGILQHLAETANDSVLCWSIPLSNIDGIEQGDYGKDPFPYDLNRAYQLPPMRHEARVIQGDVKLWATRCAPVIALDLHGPGGCESDGVYCYLPDARAEPYLHQQGLHWAELLQQALPRHMAAPNFARVARYPSRWKIGEYTPSFTSYVQKQLGIPAITIEIPYGKINDTILTREHYQTIGRNLIQGIVNTITE